MIQRMRGSAKPGSNVRTLAIGSGYSRERGGANPERRGRRLPFMRVFPLRVAELTLNVAFGVGKRPTGAMILRMRGSA